MGQKDITQKSLEGFPDVFADIINALLYQGEPVVREENPYPFIGIVLNWGKKVWKGKTSIRDYFSEHTTLQQTLKYVNNMCYPVFDMRYLTPKVRARFHSDMRIIVDFLAERDEDKMKGGYEPPKQEMKHPEEVLSMLKALAGDERFEEILKRLKEQADREAAGKEGITMCRLLDSYWDDGVNTGIERGKAEGLAEGKAQGRINTLISNLKILMDKLNLTLAQSMDMLDVADDDRLTILEHFRQA